MFYFLEAGAFQDYKKKVLNASYSEVDFEAIVKEDRKETSYFVEASKAYIPVKGVLTKEYCLMTDFFFGNTAYDELITAIRSAEADPRVNSIVLEIDSPGGTVLGLFNTLDAIYETKKPVKATVTGLACSAAYAIASQADLITAEDRGAMLGSIGVVATYHLDDQIIEVTSTEAPNKRPDVRTEEGLLAVREELDEIHELFIEAIARGRGFTKETINADFGRGSTFLAEKALSKGMLDIVGASNINQSETERELMDDLTLATLERDFPELFEEVFEAGKANERERALAHITLGRSFNAVEIALEAIEEGEDFGPLMQAKYMAKGNKNKLIEERAAETSKLPAADNVSTLSSSQEDDAMRVALLVKQKLTGAK